MTTVVFADLVGSTGLFERLGDEAASRFVTQLVGQLDAWFAAHGGRVVKRLGDGVFVVFPEEAGALRACIEIQNRLLHQPMHPADGAPAVELQMGLEAGEVVEIEGDCYGDSVNSAARLADLAGAAQILTTQHVWDAAPEDLRALLRSLGPMFLRGKNESTHLYRVEWQAGQDADATMIGRSQATPDRNVRLELVYGDTQVSLQAGAPRLSIGRAADARLHVNDARVSRTHATLEWRAGHFALTDASTYGTWVYVGDQPDAVVLRRSELTLVGTGLIVPGCERGDEQAPLIRYSIVSKARAS